jgi:hypothetical protein
MTPSTQQHIISAVVYTAAILCGLYMATMTFLAIWGLIFYGKVDKDVLTHLVQAGSTLLGFLSGMLVNTRTPSPGTAETTVTTTETQTPDTKE